MIRIIAVAALATLTAGCQTAGPAAFAEAEPESVVNVVPAGYMLELTTRVRAGLKDPDSIRDASISEPTLAFMGAAHRYVVCMRWNAKNSYGGFTGARTYVATFYKGKLLSLGEESYPVCGAASYRPMKV